ncbi:MAG: NOB1 family endonuclease [Halobacteriota archaeon]
MYVLDASAFIHEVDLPEPRSTVPEVRAELEGESAYRFDAYEGAGMHVHIPEEGTIERIRRAAGDRGDRGVLSETDVRLLAAAFELEATVVTDDYAVQNTARALDIPVEPIARDGIEEERDWLFQCAGCGREFEEEHDRCPICGSELSRKRPTNP